MRIAVCLKSVSDSSAAYGDGATNWAVNEWDACALEEALRLAELCSGEVAAFSVGGNETDVALRRALALGAATACRIAADGDDPWTVFHGLTACLTAQGPWDMVLFGAQSSDRGGGQVGGMVAAALGIPYVPLAVAVSPDGSGLRVEREGEKGRLASFHLDFPCALSVQTGINQPRYVSVRGIQRAGRIPVDTFDPPPPPPSGVRFVRSVPPPPGEVRMLEGTDRDIAAAIVQAIRHHGRQ